MLGHPGMSVPGRLVREDLWVSDVVYFPLETELVALARARGCRVVPGGGMAVHQAVGAFEYFTGRVADAGPDGPALRGADRLMRTGIATLSVRGRLLDKLPAIAAAGFDGIEVFDNDLVACPAPPREVAARCADLGLAVDLFQPVRDAAGVAPDGVRGTPCAGCGPSSRSPPSSARRCVLACSHVGDASVDDPDLLAEQLHAARRRGLRARADASPTRRWPGAGTSTGSARPGRPYGAPTTRP